MKKNILTVFALVAGFLFAHEPVDYVNPENGNISHMLVPTFPTIQRPNCLYRYTPPHYAFVDDRVAPMPLLVPSHRMRGLFRVNPFTGDEKHLFDAWRGSWDQQKATPYSYALFFDTENTHFSLAPAEQGAVAEFDFEKEGLRALVFRPTDPNGSFKLEGKAVWGIDCFRKAKAYLYGEFSEEPVRQKRNAHACAAIFGASGKPLVFRFAVSWISPDQARRNFNREVAGRVLSDVARDARAAWNRVLGRIEVEGGTEAEKRVFYTALYRCHERMVNFTEDGQYRGYDGQIHAAGAHDYYNDDWTWDSYRAHHPLMCLLDPKAEADKLTSYLRMAEQNPEKWVPLFPNISDDMHGMNGFHPPVLFLDALRKGIGPVDYAAAFRAAAHTERTSSRLPWYRGPRCSLDEFHDRHGYYPALHPGPDGTWAKDPEWPEAATHDERRQSVAVTLAYSYDCWALAELAKRYGTAADVREFTDKSFNYTNLWNAKTGFFHPKDKDGQFIQPFDYRYSGGQGARDYYDENNAWTYVWDVPHALGHLVEMLGGEKAVADKMDQMLNTPYGRSRWRFYNVLPDSTGNMGMFTMGNEPSFHIPYMYNLAGEPWKTQKFVRKVLKAWFRDDLMGMCGDEDGGGMSAFAVFSMMGFYPVTPGLPAYHWGSPGFSKVTIHLQNGKDFILEAPGASEHRKYVKALSVDGVPRSVLTPLTHAELTAGGRVRLDMSDRPCR